LDFEALIDRCTMLRTLNINGDRSWSSSHSVKKVIRKRGHGLTRLDLDFTLFVNPGNSDDFYKLLENTCFNLTDLSLPNVSLNSEDFENMTSLLSRLTSLSLAVLPVELWMSRILSNLQKLELDGVLFHYLEAILNIGSLQELCIGRVLSFGTLYSRGSLKLHYNSQLLVQGRDSPNSFQGRHSPILLYS
jgi:hypothetical protein